MKIDYIFLNMMIENQRLINNVSCHGCGELYDFDTFICDFCGACWLPF